jgi:prophage maintenance system killer protein
MNDTVRIEANKGEIVLYRDEAGPELEVRLQGETVWLTQAQMAKLFGKDVRTISEHIGNVFTENELGKGSTIRKFRIVRKEGKRSVERQIDHYSLDAIISVGYRVKSKRGTQFRIWATRVLRDHLVKGYTVYERRLKEDERRRRELADTLKLFEGMEHKSELSSAEAAGLLTVITDYTRSWLLLHRYDTGDLPVKELNKNVVYEITYAEALKAIEALKQELIERKEAGELFGRESERGKLKGILAGVNQTFGGHDLYPSIEEKAAHLLYFVIKDHPFVDGNKRIASLLFIWFLEKNNFLSNPDGERKINDNALVALALLVAESNPKQKDLMIKLVINLIGREQ